MCLYQKIYEWSKYSSSFMVWKTKLTLLFTWDCHMDSESDQNLTNANVKIQKEFDKYSVLPLTCFLWSLLTWPPGLCSTVLAYYYNRHKTAIERTRRIQSTCLLTEYIISITTKNNTRPSMIPRSLSRPEKIEKYRNLFSVNLHSTVARDA